LESRGIFEDESDYGVEVGVHEGDDFVFWAGVQLMVTLLFTLL
jgi:hypothetical protein